MIDFATAPKVVQDAWGISRFHARDVILFHRFRYYCLARPTITDFDYDCLEWYFKHLYPNDRVIDSVGSSNVGDYPRYVREFRRPVAEEREKWHVL